jgi:hypothetical protein
MRAYIRAAVPAALLSAVLLTGCSSEGGSDTADATPSLSASVDSPVIESTEQAPQETASTTPVPTLKVGETAQFGVGETDDVGENYRETTKMQVTVISAKYVTPEEVGTSNTPEHGQYVELTLTIKNVGKGTGDVMTYGMMKWEDAETAAQDASTLEGVGEGDSLDTTYKPGQSVTGKLILDVGNKGGTVSYVGTDDPNAVAAFKIELPSS